MKILLILVFAFCSLTAQAPAQAQEAPPLPARGEWSAQEKAWGYTLLGLHVADTLQTRYIAANPQRFHELNPLLGRHPSGPRVLWTMAAIGAGTYYLLDAADPETRLFATQILVTWKIIAVGRNAYIGVRMKF